MGPEFQGSAPTHANQSRLVREEMLPGRTAGWQQVRFDGRDNEGRVLASGVYFCRVEAGGSVATKKMIIAR